MRISEADRLFSLYIRNRDKWTCCRCQKRFTPGVKILTNSHFFGRGMKSVRFDPENCDALCWNPYEKNGGCHLYWQNGDREAYRNFKIKQLGQKRFDLLVLRANTTADVDEKMVVLFCKQVLANPKNTTVHL